MAGEWGKGGEEHERFLALQEQVKRVRGSGATTPAGLAKDEAWYRERSEDKTVPAKERAQWKALADELATRLGYNAPPSEQIELLSVEDIPKRST